MKVIGAVKSGRTKSRMKSGSSAVLASMHKVSHSFLLALEIMHLFKLLLSMTCVPAIGVSVSARTQLLQNVMLTDEHMARASIMLSAQFQDTTKLVACVPRWQCLMDDVNYYPPRTSSNPWVQIVNTGRQHWVTVVFLRGNFLFALPIIYKTRSCFLYDNVCLHKCICREYKCEYHGQPQIITFATQNYKLG